MTTWHHQVPAFCQQKPDVISSPVEINTSSALTDRLGGGSHLKLVYGYVPWFWGEFWPFQVYQWVSNYSGIAKGGRVPGCHWEGGHWNWPDVKNNRPTIWHILVREKFNLVHEMYILLCRWKKYVRTFFFAFHLKNDLNLFWVYHIENFPEKITMRGANFTFAPGGWQKPTQCHRVIAINQCAQFGQNWVFFAEKWYSEGFQNRIFLGIEKVEIANSACHIPVQLEIKTPPPTDRHPWLSLIITRHICHTSVNDKQIKHKMTDCYSYWVNACIKFNFVQHLAPIVRQLLSLFSLRADFNN